MNLSLPNLILAHHAHYSTFESLVLIELYQNFQEPLQVCCMSRVVHLKLNADQLATRRKSIEINDVDTTNKLYLMISLKMKENVKFIEKNAHWQKIDKIRKLSITQ